MLKHTKLMKNLAGFLIVFPERPGSPDLQDYIQFLRWPDHWLRGIRASYYKLI